jgi:mRNA-degrading endonuclease YafQ of YafQ-DinJ toxin-antitoxin module
MKLDLEYVMTELKKIKKDLKNSNKTDKKIMKQHDQIFEMLENNSNTPSNYSYGD